MSPIFRRKKHKKSAEQATTPDELNASESEGGVDAAGTSADADIEHSHAQGARSTAGSASRSEPTRTPRGEDSAQVMHRSRDERVSDAYESWHAELSERARQADTEASEKAETGLIDLTHTHPTGAATFYGHTITKLSSLIREPVAQDAAKVRLGQLQDIVAAMSEEHGHAPVAIAVGMMTWTELPEPREGELAAEPWDVTGELRLDPAELERRAAEPAAKDAEGAEVVEADDEQDETSPEADRQDVSTEAEAEVEAEASVDEEVFRQASEVSEPAIYRSVRIEFLPDGDALLQLSTKAEINPVVLRALRDNGATPDTIAHVRELVASPQGIDEGLARLQGLGRVYLPGFDYEPREVMGCFTRPEHIMLTDLEAMEPYIRTSGIMAGLAGDEATRELSSAPIPPGVPEDRSPEVERGAGDHDVDELHAIEAVASGRSIVLDCPPGSERFSTIAAIAADVAASGGSVLMIPARASSGQNLRIELEKVGLGDLVLDFSDLETVPRRIRTGMRLERPDLPVEDTLDNREQLGKVRETLARFVDDLHKVDAEWDMSIYELLETLADLTSSPDGPTTKVRLADDAVAKLSADGIDAVKTKFERAGELGAFDEEVTNSAWAGSPVSSASDGAHALDEARRLSEVSLRAVISQSSRAAGETGLTQAKSLKEWFEQVDVLDGIADSLDTFKPEIFETSAMNMVVASAPKQWRESHGHSMKISERRRYLKQAKDLLRPGVNSEDLHEDLMAVQSRRDVWRRYSTEGGWPRLPDGMSQIRVMKNEVLRDIDSLSAHLGGEDLLSPTFEELQDRLAGLVADADHMTTLPERNAVLTDLRESGFGPLLDDLIERNVPAEKTGSELELAYSSSVFEQLISKSPVLARLAPADISQLLTQLRYLDRKHVESLSGPVLLAVVNHGRTAMQSNPSDTRKLDALLAEQGLGGLRDLIATYSTLVQAARPVWIVAPTVVAEFVPPVPWADLAIVEATDQSSVASLVSPMMRGRQALVVGDTRRIAVGREISAINEIADVLPVIELPTMRAAHDEISARALLEQGYGDVLQPLPSTRRVSASRLIHVDGRGVPAPGGNGAIESTKTEVDAVLDAVLEHATARPDESLAVIAISPNHAQRVRDALRELRAQSSDVAELSSQARHEPMVIVDVTQAASIRRDHVILSVGFGKTVHGRVLHSFGVLATPAGLVGLIDAIEAPRNDLTIISALGPGEIDIRNLSTPGPHLLASLLDQAAGVAEEKESRAEGDASEEVTPLLADLVSRIDDAGWVTSANFGFQGSFRIPLVAGHPDIPGTWAVAVLMDDEGYVDEPSLRRRDRYRPEALESRGWRVHQTYSSSLFIDPEGEAQRVLDLLAEARNSANPQPVTVPTMGDQDDDGWGEIVMDDLDDPHAVSRVMPAIQDRGPRPPVDPGLALAAYSDDQLDDMVEWIAGDGIPRNHGQFVADLRDELGIRRRGGQVDAVLGNVVRRSGLVAPDAPDVTYVANGSGSEIMESEEEVLETHQEAHSEPDANDPQSVPTNQPEEPAQQESVGLENESEASEFHSELATEEEVEESEGSDLSEGGALSDGVADEDELPSIDEDPLAEDPNGECDLGEQR